MLEITHHLIDIQASPRYPAGMSQIPKQFSRKNARLDEDKVRIIRKGMDAGIPAAEFARAYGLSGEQIRKIGRREAWAWVPEDVAEPQVKETSPEDKAKMDASLLRLYELGALTLEQLPEHLRPPPKS